MRAQRLFAMILITVSLAACGRSDSPKALASNSPENPNQIVLPSEPKGIQTAVANVVPIPDYLVVPARIQPDPTRVVRVFPPVGGRVTSFAVRPGDRVRQGQVLATLESPDIAAARADYVKARADTLVKEKALKRSTMLFEHQVLAEKDQQQAQADFEMAQAELARSKERLRILGADPESSAQHLQIVAPRSGVVLDIGAATGELSKSTDNANPLCTLADLSVVWAVGEVYEKDFVGLNPGQAAEVTLNAYPGNVLKGTLANISDALDPVTHTLHLRVILPGNGRLKPEMFGTIRLLRKSSPGLVVPATALLKEAGAQYVFVQSDATHYEHRAVSTARAVDGQVEIVSGLNAGERVVSEGVLLIRAAKEQQP